MISGMNLAKSAQFDAGVDLGRRNRGMAKHFLDNAQIGTTRKKMCREAMSERMRTDITREPGCLGVTFHNLP